MQNNTESKREMIARIDAVMDRLSKIKQGLVDEINTTPKKMRMGTWVILKRENKYYQFVERIGNLVKLTRHGKEYSVFLTAFTNNYVQATEADVIRHIGYLKSKNLAYINVVYTPDTYKITNLFDSPDFKAGQEFAKITIHDHGVRPTAFDVKKCDFYLVSVDGSSGSRVRHATIEDAEKEATRLCKLTEKEAFVLGVVSSVKPIKTVVAEINRR